MALDEILPDFQTFLQEIVSERQIKYYALANYISRCDAIRYLDLNLSCVFRPKSATHSGAFRPPNREDNPIDPHNLSNRHYSPALRLAGIRVLSFHSLRHTCVALLIDAGVRPKAIQRQLGHSSISVTTDRYGHLMPSIQADAAQRLENALFAESAASEPSLVKP